MGLTWDPGDVNAEFYRHGVTTDVIKRGWSQLSENVIVEDGPASRPASR